MNHYIKTQKGFIKTSLLIGIIIGIAITSVVGTGIFLYFSREQIDELSPPIIKGLSEKSGSNLLITGAAYPESKILVYIDNQYKEDVVADQWGNFEKNIIFTTQGVNKIKVKQTYKNISSDFSKEHSVYVDLTPPYASFFKISELPDFYKQESISIEGTASPNDYIVLNENKYIINENGIFKINYILHEGDNNLNIKLSDEFNNETDIIFEKNIYVDTVPPKLDTGYCFSNNSNLGITEEYACVRIGTWQGYLDANNSIPIVGSINGNIKYITVDGRNINWDENNEIYQRINLYIYGGLNRYKVVVEDLSGNKTTAYVETTAGRIKDSIDVNLSE